MDILVITHIPSPYQVDLFNALANHSGVNLYVAYLETYHPSRSWRLPDIKHNHLMLDDKEGEYRSLQMLIDKMELVVFNNYRYGQVQKIMERCAKNGNSWCFWGERPGFRYSSLAGKLYRKIKLACLHNSSTPIWGMGHWAVKGYAKEFGAKRLYFNIPYFSNLDRFECPNANFVKDDNELVFLYSGALIKRKGVDVLATAFKRLSEEYSHIKLLIIGEGELRQYLSTALVACSERVIFTGFQQWDALPQYYWKADVLCAPSRYDGWNLVVPEGLAAGLPVISTDMTGSARELVNEGQNGWMVPANRADGLYYAMRRVVLMSESERRHHSLLAAKSVLHHSLSDGVRRFQEAAIASAQVFKEQSHNN